MKVVMRILTMALCAVAICAYCRAPVTAAEPPPVDAKSPPPSVSQIPAIDPAPAGNQVPASSTVPVTEPVVADPDYRIADEDIIGMDIWGEPQLSQKQLKVTPGGTIMVPYVGEISVMGLTQGEVADLIMKKLEEMQILFDAKVQITVLTLHVPTVRVLGAVNRPGEVSFRKGDRVLDAVASSGSYIDNAWLEKATLNHKGSTELTPLDLKKMLDGDLSQNLELQRGDTIYIPPEDYQNKFYVLGHVVKPGIYDLRDNTSVLTAINLAGGPTERGVLRSTVVVRGNPEKPERVQCNMAKLLDKGDLSQDVVLKPGDVVIVPETKRPDWQKVSQVLSTILSLTYIRRYGLF